jgi:RimJ/RimL family protein N-acetyltransferase
MEPIIYHHIKLKPLNLQELKWLLNGRDYLEKKLNLNAIPFDLSAGPEFMQEFDMALKEYLIPQVQQNEAQFEWFTHWLIIDTNIHVAIGGIGINGLPDEHGEVMLGYFVNVRYEGNSYATMATQILCDWIFKNNQVKAVIADTLHDGFASQAVLKKCGFQIKNKTVEVTRWELKNPNSDSIV